MKTTADIPMPQECADMLLKHSAHNMKARDTKGLWHKILQHKWVLSEKLGRDAGHRVMEAIPEISPTLTEEIIRGFDQDREKYAGY